MEGLMDFPPINAHSTTDIMPSQTGSDTLNPPGDVIMPSQTGSDTLNPPADVIMPSQTGSGALNPPADVIMPSQTGSDTLNPPADYTSCYRQSPPSCNQYFSFLQICILDIFLLYLFIKLLLHDHFQTLAMVWCCKR